MSRIDVEDMLDRYLKGEASPKEIERVETWLNHYGNPGSEWGQMDKTMKDQWLAGLFNEIQTSAGINDSKVVMMKPRRILWRIIAAVAASVAIFFTIYFERPAVQNTSHAGELTSLNVPVNQKKQVNLADGSKIWVNSMSELKYPKTFSKTREVYLSGEAYFDVQHDASRPFVIHTGKVVITVLGTAFNIKEDNMQHTVIVTVTRGKVSVANGNQSLGVITPNQQISVNEVSHQHMQKDVDAKMAIAWLENDIHFEDITFADAARQLEQRFKVRISFANDRVKNCRFTGSVSKEDKLYKMLKVICAFNNATYQTKADGSIVIDGRGCN